MDKMLDDMAYGISEDSAEMFDSVYAGFEKNASVTAYEQERILSSVMRKAGFDMKEIASIKKTRKISKRIAGMVIAAAVILTAGITIFAAESGGISRLKDYFDKTRDKYDISDIPVIKDAEIYGTEIIYTTEPVGETSENIAGMGSVRLVSASCDTYNIFIMLEYEADESVITADIPDVSSFGFGFCSAEIGGSYSMEAVSRTGNIFSFACHIGGMQELPSDMITLELESFGYHDDNRFVPLTEESLTVDVPMSEMNVLQYIRADNSVQIDGITYEAELSPLGLLLYNDTEAYINDEGDLENYNFDKYLFSFTNFVFYMKDGSIFGDGETYDSVYGLLRSQTGWIDFDNKKEYNSYGFTVPVDISEIDRISFHGEEFFFNALKSDQ
ncbi:MAG: hypothetical protein J1E40_02800 [Oscillospiraceae bacterium]|nr:hypothetical protein [Oscillospiraceae bacterium]